MKSSESVFTRQNPFPSASSVKRAHYHPSRKQSLSKKEKRVTLSPVRLHQGSSHPPRSQKGGGQKLSENLVSSGRDGQHVFTEIWPSTEPGSPGDSNTDFPEMLSDELSVTHGTPTVPSGVKEESVLAKYVERFRHGRPQSREERRQMVSTDGEEQMAFWWMAHSSVSDLKPTTSLDNDYSRAGQPQHDRSFDRLSDSSQGEFDDTEILQLQERANRLLLEGECSQSDGSVPVSSDGLGCSDFSSPVSVDEPTRQPLIPSLIKPTSAQVGPDSVPAASPQKSVVPTMTPPTRPEEDILFQWRLRRKMEQARGWSQSMKQSGLHDSAFSWQAPNLAHASASGHSFKQQQSSRSPQFSKRNAHPHMPAAQPEITEAHRPGAPDPSPSHFLAVDVPSSSSLMSQAQALSHVPAHMHLLCDVLPCPNQSSLANDEQNVAQKLSEPQTKVAHKKTQVSENSLSTKSEGLMKEVLPSSLYPSSGNIKEQQACQQKVFDKNKKKKRDTKELDQPTRQQRKPARDSLNPNLPKKTTSLKVQHQQDGGKEVPKGSSDEGHVTPSSPVHTALGQVVSEVLFPTAAPKTPGSSVPPPTNISSPSQSPIPLCATQNSLEVISQLLQEAEDSDGNEFVDDPLLQVLRQQRKWVKDQIREVDVMLNEFLEEEEPVT